MTRPDNVLGVITGIGHGVVDVGGPRVRAWSRTVTDQVAGWLPEQAD
jgi:hypothetical protein